jgi:hypothetical protein
MELRDEIQLRAAIVFAPLQEASEWWSDASERWRERIRSAGIEDPGATLGGALFPDWLAAVVRITTDACRAGETLWKKRDLALLRAMVRHLCARILPGGAVAGLDATAGIAPSQLWTLGRLLGLEKNAHELRLVRRVGLARPSVRPQGLRGKAARPARQSDAAQFALLRNHWGTEAAVCSVDYSGSTVRLDFSIAGERLFAGDWESRVSVDGRSLAVSQPWKCECWFSDRDADFLELTTDLGSGLSLLRQVCLGRDDDLLVLVEAVRGARPEQAVEIVSTLPMPVSLLPEADGLTREIQIPLRSRRVRLFPMHLPWERAAASSGACRIDDAGVSLQSSGSGSRCQVVFLEWSCAAADEPADGAPLTVAEDLRILGGHEACAGRLRIGDRQWMYVHQLTQGSVPRSVLGCHSESETILGRVGEAGDVEILVHVEGRVPGTEETEKTGADG